MSFFFSSKLKHPASPAALDAPLELDDDNDGGIIIVEANDDTVEPLSHEAVQPLVQMQHPHQEQDDVQSLLEDDMMSMFYDLPLINSAQTMDSVGPALVPEDDSLLNNTLSVASLNHEDWDLSQSDLKSLEDDLLQIATLPKDPHQSSEPALAKCFLDDCTHNVHADDSPQLDVVPAIQPRHHEFETFQNIALGLSLEKVPVSSNAESPIPKPLGNELENQITKPHANQIWSVLIVVSAVAVVFVATTSDSNDMRFRVAALAVGIVAVVCLGRTVVAGIVCLWNVALGLLVDPLSIMGIAVARAGVRIVGGGWRCLCKTVQAGMHTMTIVTTGIATVTSGVLLSARMLLTLLVRATITLWLCYKFGKWMTTNNVCNMETLSFIDRVQRKILLMWIILLTNSTLLEPSTLLPPTCFTADLDKVGTAREMPVIEDESLSVITGPPGSIQVEPFSYQIISRLDNYKPEDVAISYNPNAELSVPFLVSESLNNQSLIVAGLSQDYGRGIHDDSIMLHSSNITAAAQDAMVLLIGITVVISVLWLRRKWAPTAAVSTKSEGFFRTLTGEGLRVECRTRGLKAPVSVRT